MKNSTHKDMIVWQKSMQLIKAIYGVTNKFPKEEVYSLTNQIRRAAVSVPSNLAEGYAMKSTTHFIKYIYTARGSLAELETQFMIANDLDYGSKDEITTILVEINDINKMINKMLASLYQKIEAQKVKEQFLEIDSLTTDH